LNRISEAMTETLPNQIPNSGTAERLLANSLPGLLIGGGAGAKEFGWDTVGTGMMAAGALGTKTGTKLMLGAYPFQQGLAADMVASALRGGVPAVSRKPRKAEADAAIRALRRQYDGGE